MSDQVLFLHPPFDRAEFLERVLGPARSERTLRAAAVPGLRLAADAGLERVALVDDPKAKTRGALLAPGEGERERLDYLMAVLGALPVPAAAEPDDGGTAVPALAYRFASRPVPEGGWPDCNVDERVARFGEMLPEMMGHLSTRSAAEVAGLLPGIAIRALARSRGPASVKPLGLGAGLTAGDVERMEREFSYARYFAMEEHRLRHRRFDGTMSAPLDRAVFTSGDAVTVLPYDPRARTVLLIEQFRAGPNARRDPRPWCLETVAGRCDRAGETLEATARREAREEAGLELGRLELVSAYYPSPGIVAEHLTAFVAEADLSRAGGATHGLDEEHENIRTLVVPLEAALAAVDSGEINTGPLMISLLWLERHAARLRALWT